MENTEEKVIPHNYTLETFKRANSGMIATNDHAYGIGSRLSYWDQRTCGREYSPEEVQSIITHGSFLEQQRLSRIYFNRGGYYAQIILHYATLLTYAGLLIPNPSIGKNLSTPHIQKKYYNAVDYVERMRLPIFLTNCATRALVDGCYYGLVLDKAAFTTIDLPVEYCRTNFKDAEGNDIIEFNLTYFSKILDDANRKEALSIFPKEIAKAYKAYTEGKTTRVWYIIPSDISICFPMLFSRPPFLSVIPASIDYDEAVATERKRDAEEIKKIIVQKIPHLTDGRLLFEPDEALEIHNGAVGMLKGNPNISVLTSYADVEAIGSKTATEQAINSLEKMEKNIYAQAGVSSEIFTASGSASINASLDNDTAFMMVLANKFAAYVTNLVNAKFSNTNVSFKYTIYPITYHNYDKYATTAYKLASSGYSLLMPALAMGMSQKDLGNIKDLENTVLTLGEKLIPPLNSYTQGPDDGGRPAKEDGEKAETTIRKDESLDKNGGGSLNE